VELAYQWHCGAIGDGWVNWL
jgi:hypothetical protein